MSPALRDRPRDDDELGASWNAEPDAAVLVEWLRRCDHSRFIRALIASAQLVLPLIPADEQRPRELVTAAEAWLRGEVDAQAIRRATRLAFDAVKEKPRIARNLPPFGPGGVAAVRAIANVGLAINEPDAQELISYAVSALAAAALGRNDAPVDDVDCERRAALVRLSDAIRAATTRPSYDDLFGRR